MLKRLLNVIANRHVHATEIEAYRRYVLVILFFLVGMLFLCIMGVIAFIQQNVMLGSADFGIVLLLAVFVWLMWRNRRQNIYCDILISITGVFVLFLFIIGGVEKSAHVWCYSFPVVASFIVSYKKGLIYSGLLLVLITISEVLAYKFEVNAITMYPVNFLIRFYAVYIIIAFVSGIAEWARNLTYQQMVLFHNNMKKTISQLEETRMKLSELTWIDPLTQIHNKRYLEEASVEFFQHSEKQYIAALFIDIDDFKAYNDYYGHIKGDEVLVDVVRIIKDVVDSYKGMFVRFGGEELVYIMRIDEVRQTEDIAKEIIKALNDKKIKHMRSDNGYITASIGISWCRKEDCKEWEDIVTESDEAMYRAKKQGKNTYYIQQKAYAG